MEANGEENPIKEAAANSEVNETSDPAPAKDESNPKTSEEMPQESMESTSTGDVSEKADEKSEELERRERDEDEDSDGDRHSRRRHRHRSRHGSRSRRHRHDDDRRRDRHRHSRSRRRRSSSPESDGYHRKRRRREYTPERRRVGREKGRELGDDPERDDSTVFVSNVHRDVRTSELWAFFEESGCKVKDIKIIMDKVTGRSKGMAYVELDDKDEARKAIALSGSLLKRKHVVINHAQAEKNRVAQNVTVNANVGPKRLYVGSLHFNITEEDLKGIFGEFGPLTGVHLVTDSQTQRSQGYAFVDYDDPRDARDALAKMNGIEMLGRPMKVGLVTEKAAPTTFGSELDDEDGGIMLNAQSRMLLMEKLMTKSDGGNPIAKPAVATQEREKTLALLLKNMFRATDVNPEFFQDIKSDITHEVEKFGQLVNYYAEIGSPGHVYLKFAKPSAAEEAYKVLNGRWFGGLKLSAEFLPLDVYHQKVPES